MAVINERVHLCQSYYEEIGFMIFIDVAWDFVILDGVCLILNARVTTMFTCVVFGSETIQLLRNLWVTGRMEDSIPIFSWKLGGFKGCRSLFPCFYGELIHKRRKRFNVRSP